jgi:maltose/moltooligosaccharide transporter
MKKPLLSFWEIWNMSFGFLGIQFGFALQNANVSRIFETLGASVEEIPILWIAAPITGLIVQPIIGYYSDRTWNKLGRRRPYFLIGAILASLALIIMPNSTALWVAAGTLWIMDASINISMEPFRAFVGDNLPSEQRTRGFAMQSFFIGIGAVIASALPYMLTNWFGLANTAGEGEIPPSVKYSFYLGAFAFFVAVMWTVIKSKEYSPEQLESFDDHLVPDFIPEELTVEEISNIGKKQVFLGGITTIAGIVIFAGILMAGLKKELLILGGGFIFAGMALLIAGLMQQRGSNKNAFVTLVNDFQNMPKTMKDLAWVQFFSWFALFSMWIYTTAAVTSHVFGATDTTSKLYNDGADWVSVCFAVYNGIAALVAFALPVLAGKIGRRKTHALALLCGAIGVGSIFLIREPNLLLFSMVGIGVAWASILSMPYAILTGSLPSNKMGYYMGVFNFFIVIPQILAAALLGFFISKFFANESIYAMLIGAVSYIFAAILTMRVEDKDDIV